MRVVLLQSYRPTEMSLLQQLPRDCLQRHVAPFLDYRSFCALRMVSTLLWRSLPFSSCFQDWAGAIEEILLCSRNTTKCSSCLRYHSAGDCGDGDVIPGRRHGRTLEKELTVEQWLLAPGISLFRIDVDELLRQSAVCCQFKPHLFQANRCAECKYLEIAHVEASKQQKKGGRLISITPESNNGCPQKTEPLASFQHSRKALFDNLKSTLRYAWHVGPQIQATCRQILSGDDSGRLDSVKGYIYGPIIMHPVPAIEQEEGEEDGNEEDEEEKEDKEVARKKINMGLTIAAMEVELEVSATNCGWHQGHPLPPCSLSDLPRLLH